MVKNHIKRINAPKRWDILRKQGKFISRPNPGRDFLMSISLNTALKEMLGKTNTTKESKYLIKHKGVMVNAVRRYDEKFPVGFMDVITLPDTAEHFRLIVNASGMLEFHKISPAEAELKISKVATKRKLKTGLVQVNCTDGRNFRMKDKDAEKLSANDTILYSLKGQELKDVLKMEKGALVYLYKGKHTGTAVKIKDFKESNILFNIGEDVFETKRQYAFVVGKDKPVVSLPFHR
jgi:small subunit ribosomal protein S4e